MPQSRHLVVLCQSRRINMLNKLQFARVQAARWGLVAMLVVASQTSYGALFEDDEARRAIIDLRQRMQASQERMQASQERLQVMQDKLSKVATSESILDLANQNERLRSEISQLRGQNEQLSRTVDDLSRLVNSTDNRLSLLEPMVVSVDRENFSVGPKEKADYESAMTALRGSDFEKARVVLQGILRDFPESGYTPSVLFWLGNAYYATGQYGAALTTFDQLTNQFAQHLRVPEAMLVKANCQVELLDKLGARKNLQALITNFPNSEAAQAAKQRLDALK